MYVFEVGLYQPVIVKEEGVKDDNVRAVATSLRVVSCTMMIGLRAHNGWDGGKEG